MSDFGKPPFPQLRILCGHWAGVGRGTGGGGGWWKALPAEDDLCLAPLSLCSSLEKYFIECHALGRTPVNKTHGSY